MVTRIKHVPFWVFFVLSIAAPAYWCHADTPADILNAPTMSKGYFGESIVRDFYLAAGRKDILGKWHPTVTGPDGGFELSDGSIEVHEVGTYSGWPGRDKLRTVVNGRDMDQLSNACLSQWEKRVFSNPLASETERTAAQRIRQARLNGKLVRIYDEINLGDGKWRSSNAFAADETDVTLEERLGPVSIDRLPQKWADARLRLEKLRVQKIVADTDVQELPKLVESGEFSDVLAFQAASIGEGAELILTSPETPKITSLDELIQRTTGQPSAGKVAKYAGDLDAYWQASESAFSGKAFEAMIAHQENLRLAAAGRSERMCVSAVESELGPAHPADLVLIDDTGRVIQRYQCKLGGKAAIDALNDAKYAGMTILTPDDQFEWIGRELLEKQASAMRRGIDLDPYWARVEAAINEGRLNDLPSGAALPLRTEATERALSVVAKSWEELASATEVPGKVIQKALTSITRIPGAGGAGRVFGHCLIVLDVATNVYLSYADYQRFEDGEIGAHYFAFKLSLRSTQTAAVIWAAVADPEPMTKGVLIVAGVALVAVNVGSDFLYGEAQMRTRQMLGALERDERYYLARRDVLASTENNQ